MIWVWMVGGMVGAALAFLVVVFLMVVFDRFDGVPHEPEKVRPAPEPVEPVEQPRYICCYCQDAAARKPSE